MPSTPLPYQRFCPPELTAAAQPLASAGRLLRVLSDDARLVAALAGGSPNPLVADALERFLTAYSGRLFALAGEAATLGRLLRLAAESYAGTEQALHDRAMALSARTRS